MSKTYLFKPDDLVRICQKPFDLDEYQANVGDLGIVRDIRYDSDEYDYTVYFPTNGYTWMIQEVALEAFENKSTEMEVGAQVRIISPPHDLTDQGLEGKLGIIIHHWDADEDTYDEDSWDYSWRVYFPDTDDAWWIHKRHMELVNDQKSHRGQLAALFGVGN